MVEAESAEGAAEVKAKKSAEQKSTIKTTETLDTAESEEKTAEAPKVVSLDAFRKK